MYRDGLTSNMGYGKRDIRLCEPDRRAGEAIPL